MRVEARTGSALLEALVLAGVLGMAAAGIVRLATGALRAEGETRRRMAARNLALAGLEGRFAGLPPPEGCVLRRNGGRLEARVAWREGDRDREVRLGVWCGHE
jgi:hypothetical protein